MPMTLSPSDFSTLGQQMALSPRMRAEALAKARIMENVTKVDLATAIGVDPKTLARTEKSCWAPQDSNLISLWRHWATKGVCFIIHPHSVHVLREWEC